MTARMSSMVTSLYRRALITMSKLVAANGVFANWKTLVPRFAILFST